MTQISLAFHRRGLYDHALRSTNLNRHIITSTVAPDTINERDTANSMPRLHNTFETVEVHSSVFLGSSANFFVIVNLNHIWHNDRKGSTLAADSNWTAVHQSGRRKVLLT
jgi:hypothetical protein